MNFRSSRPRAIFMARDGVLNYAPVRNGLPESPRRPGDFVILPGVREACGRLQQQGFLLVVVTNQPDMDHSSSSRDAITAMHDVLAQQLPLDRIEVCYDAGEAHSIYRKPQPGMLLRVAADWELDLKASFMIGHRSRDIECGRAAGCTTVLIDRHYREPLRFWPDHGAASLLEVSAWILAHESETTIDFKQETPLCSALRPYSSSFPRRSTPTAPIARE